MGSSKWMLPRSWILTVPAMLSLEDSSQHCRKARRSRTAAKLVTIRPPSLSSTPGAHTPQSQITPSELRLDVQNFDPCSFILADWQLDVRRSCCNTILVKPDYARRSQVTVQDGSETGEKK